MMLTLSIFVKERFSRIPGYVYSNVHSAFYMIPGRVSMLRIRCEKTIPFDCHSVNKAYICGNRMGDMGLG